MNNHTRNKHDLLLTFSPTSQQDIQGEFIQLVKDNLASYSANDIYSSEIAGICVECIWGCLKINGLKEIILPQWEIKENCVVDGRGFSQYLEKGKKYQFVSKISPWRTLKFREIRDE